MSKQKQKEIGKIITDPHKSYPGNAEGMQKTIIEAVNNFIFCDFQNNFPLGYLYEADIQSNLAFKLSQQISSPIVFSDKENTYRLTPITREYPVRLRHDIVCINPFLVNEYVEWRLGEKSSIPLSHILWELPLLVGIEIKYSLFGYTLQANESSANDAKKLRNYKCNESKSKRNYHEERNDRSDDKSNLFTKDFKYLSIMFFQDEDWFTKHIEDQKIKSKLSEKLASLEYNGIYLVGPQNQVFRYIEETDH